MDPTRERRVGEEIEIMGVETTGREALNAVLLEDDCRSGLWKFVDSGLSEEWLPELDKLKLEQDPVHKHKDVLAHTIAVTGKTRTDLRLRLAALFHDIGKPATRSFEHGGVTFRHHEAVGAKITRKRMRALGYEPEMVKDVTELVRLSGRFKGYADGWSDSAIRRYARDAGHLLGDLNELVRCDCTTRNKWKREELQALVDELEGRITELAEADRKARERPAIDGDRVMELLDVGPGRDVGEALKFLLEMRRSGDAVEPEHAEKLLMDWWEDRQA